MRPWVNMLQREYPDYQAKFEPEDHPYYDVIFLTRYKGAPKNLPMLDSATVKEVSAQGSTVGYWEIQE